MNELSKTRLSTFCSMPPDVKAAFGEPPLLSTEDANIYWAMLDHFAEAVDPKNAIEWIWVKDIADLSWEIARLRRYRAMAIEDVRAKRNAEIEHMREHADDPEFFLDCELTPEAINRRRNVRRLDTEADSANLLVLRDHLATYETIDKLLASSELRRDRILRELDFRRERVAPLLRKKSDELIEASADAVPLATE
jgi:hypothetical protein